jgi:hypothetical protein
MRPRTCTGAGTIPLLPDPQDGEAGRAAKDQVRELLRAWNGGDTSALEWLTPIVYEKLHRLARRYMRGERPGHSLQTTALEYRQGVALSRTGG